MSLSLELLGLQRPYHPLASAPASAVVSTPHLASSHDGPFSASLTDEQLLAVLRSLARTTGGRELDALIAVVQHHHPELWRAFWARVRFPGAADDPAGCWTWRSVRAGKRSPYTLSIQIPRCERLGGGHVAAHPQRVAWEFLGWGSTATLCLQRHRERCGNERCIRPDHADAHERRKGRWPGVLEVMGLEASGAPTRTVPAVPVPKAPIGDSAVQIVGPFKSGGCVAFTPYGTIYGDSPLAVCAEYEQRAKAGAR